MITGTAPGRVSTNDDRAIEKLDAAAPVASGPLGWYQQWSYTAAAPQTSVKCLDKSDCPHGNLGRFLQAIGYMSAVTTSCKYAQMPP